MLFLPSMRSSLYYNVQKPVVGGHVLVQPRHRGGEWRRDALHQHARLGQLVGVENVIEHVLQRARSAVGMHWQHQLLQSTALRASTPVAVVARRNHLAPPRQMRHGTLFKSSTLHVSLSLADQNFS